MIFAPQKELYAKARLIHIMRSDLIFCAGCYLSKLRFEISFADGNYKQVLKYFTFFPSEDLSDLTYKKERGENLKVLIDNVTKNYSSKNDGTLPPEQLRKFVDICVVHDD